MGNETGTIASYVVFRGFLYHHFLVISFTYLSRILFSIMFSSGNVKILPGVLVNNGLMNWVQA